MQKSWRSDTDKLTFIACMPPEDTTGQQIQADFHDTPDRMIGDVNLFLSPADEDDEGCIGELELMIAPLDKRRQGYGRATILSFMHYIERHLPEILAEYKGDAQGTMKLLQLKVKIGSKNEKSIGLFESIGYLKVGEGANYFGEIELSLEGFLGDERTSGLLNRWEISDYEERPYHLGTKSTE